jgi:hypothetical protein
MSKNYEVPCSWQVYAWANVEANSFDEAIEFVESDQFPLPEGSYVEGSFELDHDMLEFERENLRQQIRSEADDRRK